MTRRYSLDAKIEALNLIDRLDGNIAAASDGLEISMNSLAKWRAQESTLRKAYDQRRQRERARLFSDLQLEMLERGKAIVSQLDDQRLEKAPLNQLATALSSLVGSALKLSDVIEEFHEDRELVIRHEYFYDGQVQDAPPWADRGDGEPRAFQGGRLREALGQDHSGQNGHPGSSILAGHARLVADADSIDGEPGLAGFEGSRYAHSTGENQRERAPD